jgi:hypothetical protein
MDKAQERAMNQEAYRRLKGVIGQNYPRGRFVAITRGQIAGDAATFDELLALLRVRGEEPSEALIVQAGIDYPEFTYIFSGQTA